MNWKPLSDEAWRPLEFVHVMTLEGGVRAISTALLDDIVSGNTMIAELLGGPTSWTEIGAGTERAAGPIQSEIFELYCRLLALEKHLKEVEKFSVNSAAQGSGENDSTHCDGSHSV